MGSDSDSGGCRECRQPCNLAAEENVACGGLAQGKIKFIFYFFMV